MDLRLLGSFAKWALQSQLIALTAFAYDNDRSVALLAGCTEYITKPYRL